MSDSEKVKEDIPCDKQDEDLTGKEDITSTEVKAEEPVSKPKDVRKPRINRRSFHLYAGENGCDNTKSQNETDSSEKKAISPISFKSNPSESKPAPVTSKKIILKKSSCDVNIKRTSDAADVSSSSEPQPKRKHKPITWP